MSDRFFTHTKRARSVGVRYTPLARNHRHTSSSSTSHSTDRSTHVATATLPAELPTDRKGLICAVCHEIYRSPRILPCFHTFCLYCLEDISRSKGGRNFPCPTCRKPTPIPSGGSLGFQVNFYITEKELEAARNGPGSTMCPQPTHQMNPLEYFCVACDIAICLKCKLTKHEHHGKTLDLFEAAAACRVQLEDSKDRLEKAVDVLTKKSEQSYVNQSAAKQKATEIKAEVQTARDALIARVHQRYDTVLKQVDRSNSSLEQLLSRDVCAINKERDALLQLQQRILHGLSSSASHAEVVSAEKEMREGQGSTPRLEQVVSSCSPATSLRPGLWPDHSSCSDSDIDRYLGVPMVLTLPFDAEPELIVPIYQCGQDGACRQVHSLCHVTDNDIYISFGGALPDYTGETVIKITDQGEMYNYSLPSKDKNCKVTFLYHNSRPTLVRKTVFKKETNNKLNAKGGVWMMTDTGSNTQFVREIELLLETQIFCTTKLVCSFQCGLAVAFDATQDKQMFAFVGKKTAEHRESAEYSVLLFHRDQHQPFTTYRPADVPGFLPTDVCFWPEDEQGEKLLVADEHNDAVHVVSVENNQCRFERYLAAGNGLLLRPTALNVDRHNHVWIGCGNGWILRCDPPKAGQLMEKTAGDDTQSHADCNEVGQLSVGNPSRATGVLSQASCAVSSEMDHLTVRNCSEVTDVLSKASCAGNSEMDQLTVRNCSEVTDILSQASCADNTETDQLTVRNCGEVTDTLSEVSDLIFE